MGIVTPAVVVAAGAQARAISIAGTIEDLLATLSRGLADAILTLPVAGVAVLVGLAVWRGRAPIAGAVAAITVHLVALAGGWRSSVLTVSIAIVLTALAWPSSAALAAGLRALRGRRPRWLTIGRTAASPPLPPTSPSLIVPVLACCLPALAIVTVIVTGVWFPGLLFVTLTASAVLASAPSTARSAEPARLLLLSFSVVAVIGLVGGPGIGGDLARALPQTEVRAAFRTLLTILSTLAVLVIAAAPSGGRRGAPPVGARSPGTADEQPAALSPTSEDAP